MILNTESDLMISEVHERPRSGRQSKRLTDHAEES